MRLYRGLTKPYQSEKVVARADARPINGTDFTDCPFTALLYARGSRGVVLVLDVAKESPGPKVTEELWLGVKAKRFMVWGKFDELIVGIIPAKELRAPIRRKGVAASSDEYKAAVLKHEISDRFAAEAAMALRVKASLSTR